MLFSWAQVIAETHNKVKGTMHYVLLLFFVLFYSLGTFIKMAESILGHNFWTLWSDINESLKQHCFCFLT